MSNLSERNFNIAAFATAVSGISTVSAHLIDHYTEYDSPAKILAGLGLIAFGLAANYWLEEERDREVETIMNNLTK